MEADAYEEQEHAEHYRRDLELYGPLVARQRQATRARYWELRAQEQSRPRGSASKGVKRIQRVHPWLDTDDRWSLNPYEDGNARRIADAQAAVQQTLERDATLEGDGLQHEVPGLGVADSDENAATGTMRVEMTAASGAEREPPSESQRCGAKEEQSEGTQSTENAVNGQTQEEQRSGKQEAMEDGASGMQRQPQVNGQTQVQTQDGQNDASADRPSSETATMEWRAPADAVDAEAAGPQHTAPRPQ